MHLRHIIIAVCLIIINQNQAFSAFPDDLDDVTFIEEGFIPGLTNVMRAMPVTASLSVQIGGANPLGGQNVILDNSKRNTWPGILGCCNANAWLIVKVDEIWYAGTWEFMRVGQTTKSTKALLGAGHLRFPPLSRFQPVVGEIYGFMMSGITRNGLASINIHERSEVSFYKFGVGPVSAEEAVPSSNIAAAIVPILTFVMEEEVVPTLTMLIAAAEIGEQDGAAATTATVSRNTNTTSSLNITLVSSDISEATVPVSVTIAAGQSTSPVFNIGAENDSVADGTQTVTITASATAHADGVDTLDVIDDDD